MSLRTLERMALARLRADWTRDAAMTSRIANAVRMSGKPIDPQDLVPKALRPKPEPPAELSAEERAAGWDKFDAAFGIKG